MDGWHNLLMPTPLELYCSRLVPSCMCKVWRTAASHAVEVYSKAGLQHWVDRLAALLLFDLARTMEMQGVAVFKSWIKCDMMWGDDREYV